MPNLLGPAVLLGSQRGFVDSKEREQFEFVTFSRADVIGSL